MFTKCRGRTAIYNTQSGYSLVGVSLFIVVLGIMIAGGLGLKQQYDWAQRQEITTANMTLVKTALNKYQSENGRLPCPASLSAPLDTKDFGRETDCDVAAVAGETFTDRNPDNNREIRYGAVPVRTLGLPDDAIVDGWQHRYVYAVTAYYANKNPANINFNEDMGAIKIISVIDNKTQYITKDKTGQTGNVIYTVMSPGADKRGAYSMNGDLLTAEAGDDCKGTNCLKNNGDGAMQVDIFRQYSTGTGGSNKDFTATMAYASSNISYEWFAGKWSDCNCCDKQKTRKVECRIKGTKTKANGKCAAADKPVDKENCTAYCWTATPWETQGSCGPTTQTRERSCKDNRGKDAPDDLCGKPKLNPLSRDWNAGNCCTGGGSSNDKKWNGFVQNADGTSNWVESSMDQNYNVTSVISPAMGASGSYTTQLNSAAYNQHVSSGGGGAPYGCGSVICDSGNGGGGQSQCTPNAGADVDEDPLDSDEYFVDVDHDGAAEWVGKGSNMCHRKYKGGIAKPTTVKTKLELPPPPPPPPSSGGGGSSSDSDIGFVKNSDGSYSYIAGGGGNINTNPGHCMTNCGSNSGAYNTGGTGFVGSGGVQSGGSSSSGSSSGSGSSSSSSRIMCTHFMRRGRLSRGLWRADLEFTFDNVFPCTIRGYHFWGIPAVNLMRRYPWTEAIFWPIVIHRAEEIAFQMGLRDKPNYLGKVVRMIVEPVSFLIGIFVPEQNWQKVHADMQPVFIRK